MQYQHNHVSISQQLDTDCFSQAYRFYFASTFYVSKRPSRFEMNIKNKFTT